MKWKFGHVISQGNPTFLPIYTVLPRAIKSVTRRDRVTNVNNRKELRVEPLLEEVERIQLGWYGPVMRMMDDRWDHRKASCVSQRVAEDLWVDPEHVG